MALYSILMLVIENCIVKLKSHLFLPTEPKMSPCIFKRAENTLIREGVGKNQDTSEKYPRLMPSS